MELSGNTSHHHLFRKKKKNKQINILFLGGAGGTIPHQAKSLQINITTKI